MTSARGTEEVSSRCSRPRPHAGFAWRSAVSEPRRLKFTVGRKSCRFDGAGCKQGDGHAEGSAICPQSSRGIVRRYGSGRLSRPIGVALIGCVGVPSVCRNDRIGLFATEDGGAIVLVALGIAAGDGGAVRQGMEEGEQVVGSSRRTGPRSNPNQRLKLPGRHPGFPRFKVLAAGPATDPYCSPARHSDDRRRPSSRIT